MSQERKQQALDAILRQGVLPLYFHPDQEVSMAVLQALYSAGIRAVEYTNRGSEALENFKALLQLRDGSLDSMLLGIGTIKNAAQAKLYSEAGADFLISPGTIPEVNEVATEAGLLWVPGCMSTTEIIQAENMGRTFVKLFPGNLLGPAYVSSIRNIFPGMQFMPTGGVEMNEDNIRSWFKAGVSAVGMGSKLISKELLEARDYASIKRETGRAIELVHEARSPFDTLN